VPYISDPAVDWEPHLDPRSVAVARRISTLCGILVIGVGSVVLAGWIWKQVGLTAFGGEITMKTNAAIALLCGGAGLLTRARAPRVAAACGACCAAIGALTILEHLTGWNLGIDQALFREAGGAIATASPNRMGLNASTSLTLAGLALMLTARESVGAIQMAQRLAVIGIVVALLTLSGFIYGATQLYSVAAVSGIAWHTAFSLLALHIGVLTTRTDAGLVMRFVSNGPEGTMLRRQALPVTFVPFMVGYLILIGVNAKLFDLGLSLSLLVMTLIVLLWVTSWGTAWSLEQSDAQRRRLERGVDQLLIRERQARDEAVRANRLKDQFIATLSHELRTPLNVMLGWTKILESGIRPDQHTRAAAVVARNGRLLARLIEDLLDISRAAAGQFDVTRGSVALNTLVQTAIDAIMPVATAKPVRLEVDLDPQLGAIQADADRLQQVIGNLLSNAVKFTAAGGSIQVRTVTAGNAARLDVIDSGIGFDQSFATHIFEPFRQADASTRREFGGLGLGLSIAKHHVELHGGSITAFSEGRGRGARFSVTLPAVAHAGATPPRDSSLQIAPETTHVQTGGAASG
jgi:signal transduction histidine kinase